MAWSKESSHARGYGAHWQKVRRLVMQRDGGICHCPDCQGGKLRLLPAHDVDHITPKAEGGTDDMENLRAVNRECHKRLTIVQRGHTPRQEIGVDGWPVLMDGAGGSTPPSRRR